MSPIAQMCCCNDATPIVEGSNVSYTLRLYAPCPTLRMVIISNVKMPPDRLPIHFVPSQMVSLANQAVRVFKLNPSQVVWIEHYPSQGNPLSGTVFHLINFDWQAGQAISPSRSPINEDWYLSWLIDEFVSDDLDNKVQSATRCENSVYRG
jgi:hypothetical protein